MQQKNILIRYFWGANVDYGVLIQCRMKYMALKNNLHFSYVKLCCNSIIFKSQLQGALFYTAARSFWSIKLWRMLLSDNRTYEGQTFLNLLKEWRRPLSKYLQTLITF